MNLMKTTKILKLLLVIFLCVGSLSTYAQKEDYNEQCKRNLQIEKEIQALVADTITLHQTIEKFDAERLAVGKAYGIDLLSVNEWIKFAYKDTKGTSLCERMKNNPAYHDIKAPGSIFTRQLTEDIPTGVLPIMELGKVAGVDVPLMSSMVVTIEALLGMDFHTNGRSLKNLGLSGMSKKEILNFISNGK